MIHSFINSWLVFIVIQVGEQNNVAPKGLPDVSSISIKDEKKSSGTIWGDNNYRSSADLEKPEKVGSLTFKVIDASSLKKPTPPPKQTSLDGGSSVSTSQGPKSDVKKPASRAKVPFQIGYSHMDWLKLTRTHPDLAGTSINCSHLFFITIETHSFLRVTEFPNPYLISC